jgi:hypothetical protein
MVRSCWRVGTVTGLWMISGNLGSGKTATLVWLARKHYAAGRKIMANFSLHDSFKATIAPAEILLMHRHQNCTILIDELWTMIDSRSSTTGENKFLNDIILSSRKRGVTIMGTSQMPSMVDKRYRDIADYTILCERKGLDRSLNATIKVYVTSPDWAAKMGLAIKGYRFKVRDVAHLYNTDETIEHDKELYISEMARLIKKDQPKTMQRLHQCENITEQRDILQTFAGIKRSMQVAILQELGVR